MSATDPPLGILNNLIATSGSSSVRRSDRSSQSAPCHPITGAKVRPEIGWTPGDCAAGSVVIPTIAAIAAAPSTPMIVPRMQHRIAAVSDARPSPSRLWKAMTLDQRQRAARAFWSDPDAAADQAQAAVFVAQQKKFRPKTVIALDEAHKARHLASIASLPDTIAARALV